MKINGKWGLVLMHRFILDAPKNFDVDHINGDGLDNRRANLRICTHSENLCNTKKHRNGRLLGTCLLTQKRKGRTVTYWKAQKKINGVSVYIGIYPTEKLAHKAFLNYGK